MEPVVNGTCLLNSDGVHPDRCVALGILEQDKCFWKSWKVKSFLNLTDMLQCELLWYHCVDFSFARVNCSVISYPLSRSKLSSFFFKISNYSTFDILSPVFLCDKTDKSN